MIKFIKNIFKKKVFVNKKPNTYSVGGGWGNKIEWFTFNQEKQIFKVCGWKDNKPKKGDILFSPMQSGKTAKFVFLKTEYCNDPPDMFFADVGFLEYK